MSCLINIRVSVPCFKVKFGLVVCNFLLFPWLTINFHEFRYLVINLLFIFTLKYVNIIYVYKQGKRDRFSEIFMMLFCDFFPWTVFLIKNRCPLYNITMSKILPFYRWAISMILVYDMAVIKSGRGWHNIDTLYTSILRL